MSSPVSFGDVIKALELINWIRNNCFDPVNNAQIRYLEFKREIEGLEQQLKDFRDAFKLLVGHVGSDAHILDAPQQQAVLKQEADRLIGNFLQTLRECEKILQAHIKLDDKKGTILDNAFWASSTQGQIEDLRRRIQAHADKTALFIEPVRMRLDSDMVANTYDILEILTDHVGLTKKSKLPAIPSSLDTQFRNALLRNQNIKISHPSKIPLQEGVDIMTLHYRQSTVLSSGSLGDQTVQQYLHLVKAHWLVETLIESDALQRTRPGHLYKRIIKQVERGIAEQYQRKRITRYSEEELCALDTSAFELWPPPVIVEEAPLTQPIDREELLARLQMASQSSNEKRELYIFRVDDRNLRVVYVRGMRETERFFNLLTDSMMPFYTIASGQRTEWNVLMFYGSGTAKTDYPLQSRADAFSLQRALTGYQTVVYSEAVSCVATYKKILRDGQRVSMGEVQLWEWPALDSVSTPPASPRSPQHFGSVLSGSSYSRVSRAFDRTNRSIVSVSEAESGKTVVVAALPPSPIIMAFLQDAKTYTFWQVKLDLVEMEKSHPGDQYLGFGPKIAGNTFPARMLTVVKSDLRSWNICALFHEQILANDKTRKTKSKDQPNFKTADCTHLSLDFSSEKAKVDFELKIFDVMTRRLAQLADAGDARGIAEREARVPTVVQYPQSPGFRRRDSTMSDSMANSSCVSIAPRLPPLTRVPSIIIEKDSVLSPRRDSHQKKFG